VSTSGRAAPAGQPGVVNTGPPLRDVLARAAQPVADRLGGGLRAGDLLVERRELALREPLPVAGPETLAGAGSSPRSSK